MLNRFLKVSSITPKIKVSNVAFNTRNIEELYLKHLDSSIVLTPELSLTGYTCQDLFFQKELLVDVVASLLHLKEIVKDNLLVVGAPLKKGNSLYNCAVFLNDGRIIGVIPKSAIPNYGEFYEARWFASGKDIEGDSIEIGPDSVPFGTDLLFFDRQSGATIGAEICEDLWVMDKPSTRACLNGANIILNLSASDEIIGKKEYRRDLVKMQSSTCYCAYLYCSSGDDESSQDLVFSGHNIIAENGTILRESIYADTPNVVSAILDLDKIDYNRIHQSTLVNEDDHYRRIPLSLTSIFTDDVSKDASTLIKADYPVSRFPFVPTDDVERRERCLEILSIQAHGLATRVKNSGIHKLVIGVSGGLDSTLALLVAAEAKKIVPEIQIIGITMPLEGNTTSLTYHNALSLMKELGVESREISIRDTLSAHLKSIGHPLDYEGEKDVTYENAQARIRTLILMDVSNREGGLVVGTGDLSELALGWCTYNGDHMSMYGVNCSVPKTLVQYLVKIYAETLASEELRKVLLSVVATPISPELTPNKNDRIVQKTEDKIGKYDLNDFFLFYTLRYGFLPRKIITLALVAYKELSKEEIKKAFERFIRRFYSQQFKRSCLPDGVKVGSVSLSPRGDFRMSSDTDVNGILKQLESI